MLCTEVAYAEACTIFFLWNHETSLNPAQITTLPNDTHPTGYIVSNAEDLLSLFDADYGVLVVGEGAKILGPNLHGRSHALFFTF